MARQDRSPKEKTHIDSHTRQLRRNQIIFSVFAGLLILSMILSLVKW